MFVAYKRSFHRFHLSLAARHKVNRRVVSEYIGALGSIPLVGPISAEERARYWGRLPGRLAEISAKRPLTPADVEKIKALVARRIAPLGAMKERRRQALSDLVDGLARFDGDQAFDEAAGALGAIGTRSPASTGAERSVRPEGASGMIAP
jgi:hypothetical protein